MSPTVQIDVPFTPMYRQEVIRGATALGPCVVEFTDRPESLDSQLDTGSLADLAAVVLALIGLILQFEQRADDSRWTLARIEETVREQSAKVLGVVPTHPYRYVGVDDFLAGTRDACRVIVEIADEQYVFVVSRDASVVVIRLHVD